MRKISKVITVIIILVSSVMVLLTAPGANISPGSVTITVDPGHGGVDPGAVVAGVTEKQVNLEIALKVKEIAKDHPPLNVVLTRDTDEYLYLKERLRLAESYSSAAYVSIQANSFSDPNVVGIETIVDDTRPKTDLSWDLSRLIHSSTAPLLNTRDRGIKDQRLYTRFTSIPAALMEVGFLTSPIERKKLINEHYQYRIAKGIVEGLLKYVTYHVD